MPEAARVSVPLNRVIVPLELLVKVVEAAGEGVPGVSV
jgi:hypothetical protein